MDNEELVRKIQDGEEKKCNMLKLWAQNQGFIGKMAVKYSSYAEIEDLKQEGYFGLCEAVRHYEPDKGTPFINYAAFWIRQVMRRYIDNCGSVVRIPVGAREEIRKYKKMCNEYRKYYGAEPSESELCALLRVKREELHAIQNNARMKQIQSLGAPIGDEGGELTIEDMVASGENVEEDCISRLDRERMKRELWIAVNSLPDKQAETIKYQYMDNVTLKEIGELQGVSIESVRRRKNEGIKTIRRSKQGKKLRVYYEQYLSAAPVHHVGVQSFQRTWTSEVEKAVIG